MTRTQYIYLLLIGIILGLVVFVVSYQNLQQNSFSRNIAITEKAIEAKDWPLAERLLQSILHADTKESERWELWLTLLKVRQNQETYSMGMLVYLESMLTEFNDYPDRKRTILFKLADACISLRQFEQAHTTLEQLLALPNVSQEERASIYRDMAKVNISLRRYDMAKDDLRTCLNLPDLASESIGICKYELTNIFYVEDNLVEAMKLADEIFAMPEISDELRGKAGFILGDSLAEQDKREEALAMFKKIRMMYPNTSVIDNYIDYLESNAPPPSTLKRLTKQSSAS